MADFDLIQTDAQVQSILNDGQNMQGAGAQTTLTTESVLLKDVNGNYHKILKSSFTEAIRDTLAGLLVNNDKGTTINQIAAIASGDFGSITPANLASVLGGSVSYLLPKDRTKVRLPVTNGNVTYEVGLWGDAYAIVISKIGTNEIIFVTKSTNAGIGTESAPSYVICGIDGEGHYIRSDGRAAIACRIRIVSVG